MEYNDFTGTFSQNGEELSMEQIDDLTLLHKAGRVNFRRGNTFNSMHKNENVFVTNNSLNHLGILASYLVGVPIGLIGILGVTWNASAAPVEFYIMTAAAVGLGAVSYKAASRIVLSKEMCLPRRDKEFKKVAEKLNRAINEANQSLKSI